MPIASSLNVHFALYYSIAASQPAVNPLTDFTGWTLARASSPVIVGVPIPGRIAGLTHYLDDAPGGSTVWMFAVAWVGNYSDFTTAKNAYSTGNLPSGLGWTSAWQQPTGNPNGTPPTAPQGLVMGPSGFNGLTIVPLTIPEPGSIALLALGATALAWFRRKRV